MNAALVTPSSLLEHTQPFSKYHLILAHKVIESRRYREFYQKRSKAGDYIILDNGAVEKGGRSIPLRKVVLASILVNPTVVVLPDYLFDSHRTLDSVEDTLRSPQFKFLKRTMPDIRLCVVVQGVDEADWLECFKILNNPNNGIDVLGIPKITGHIFGKRWKVLEKIGKRVKKPCHLFGVWWKDTLEDIAIESQYSFVQGIDTPKPIRLAAQGLYLEDWKKLQRGKDFLDSYEGKVDLDILGYNCTKFVEMCNGKGV